MPTPLIAPAEKVKEGDAIVALEAPAMGALLVQDEEGRQFRLSWEPETDLKDTRRALPAGSYKIVGARHVTTARKDEVWHTSLSGLQLGTLELEAGKTKRVTLDPTIHLKTRRHRAHFSVQVTGPLGAGLSLYKNGVRIPLGYRVMRGEEELAKGDLRYG